MHQPPDGSVPIWKLYFQRASIYLRRAVPTLAGVALTLVIIWLANWLFPPPPPLSRTDVDKTVTEAIASITPMPAYSSSVYHVIRPSLVLIQSEQGSATESNSSLGSGIVIDKNARILTSLHVVENAQSITVTFADGTESSAWIISAQPEHDIAVLQPEKLPELLVPAVLGNPQAMNVGDEAYVVGHPLGLYASMSAGVISGFDRSFHPPGAGQRLEGLIQFDAAVNPGNSGGPLLNRDGYVVGIVTGLANPTESKVFIGIGFAVPINVAVGGGGSPPY